MGRALLNVPASAKAGETIEIKALVAHVMETGYRHEIDGSPIPRDIINHFTCTYNGTVIFEADFYPAIAANPFLSFTTVATETGVLTFIWTDDNGLKQVETARLTVT